MKTILALIGLAAAIGFAQEPGMHKKQMKMMNMPHYDAANVTTISGSVTEVKQHMGMGIHLIVNTADQVYEVHVGPMAYLTKNKISFSKGDAVTVTGSKMKYEGADAIMAREIKRGGETFTLRDEAGKPKWSASEGMMDGAKCAMCGAGGSDKAKKDEHAHQ